jgi:hypothetical protein
MVLYGTRVALNVEDRGVPSDRHCNPKETDP